MSLLSDHTTENIYHCNKCGLCLAACPVYKEALVESASPRGKVQLTKHILEGGLPVTERMKDILSRCLLCGSCVAACPSGVQGNQLFSGLRWRAVQRYGIDWRKRVLFQILAHQWAQSGCFYLARWAQKALGSRVNQRIHVGALPLSRIPAVNLKPFGGEIPGVVQPKEKVRARVLYFHGCATNYLYSAVGHAVIRVLSQMGVEVITPTKQGCCGIPIMLSGDWDTSLECIRSVLDTFARSEVDAVIVDCPTCGLAFRKEYAHLLRELKEAGVQIGEDTITSAGILASKTIDIGEFIGKRREWLPDIGRVQSPLKVTYHDPCHLLKGQGVGVVPRQLLQTLPGVDFIEMDDAGTCCGGGGSFQIEHPELSVAITKRKIENIYRSQADVLATGCPGCRLTISAHLSPSCGIKVLHPVQLVDQAIACSSDGG